MDYQKLVNIMNQQQSDIRAEYHLTYGELIDALKSAPKDAKFDKRVKGIGSWRGSYIEIALFTGEEGLYVQDDEFNGRYEDYDNWNEEHSYSVSKLPRNANQLGKLLESLLGKDFIGYKGGNFEITRGKPLWLEKDSSSCNEVAIVGIDDKLNLVLKKQGGK